MRHRPKQRRPRAKHPRRPPMSDDRNDEIPEETVQHEEPAAEPRLPGDTELSEFFSTFTGPGYRFIINRKDPKNFLIAGQLRRVGGHMETLEQPPRSNTWRKSGGAASTRSAS